MAIQIYANIQWPVEKLANSGFVKINLHVNEQGSLIKFAVSSGLDPLIDSTVLQAFSLFPKSDWKAGYINNQSIATEFEAWVKYNPDAPEDNLLLLKNVKESKYQQPDFICILVVEHMPSFPGGQSALLRFMAENLTWPESCKESTVGGMMVVQFTVEPDGSITNSKVVKSLHPDFDQVGLNLVNRMPTWIPGRRRGMPTRTQMNLPIRIKLE
jgi:TonB family protein